MAKLKQLLFSLFLVTLCAFGAGGAFAQTAATLPYTPNYTGSVTQFAQQPLDNAVWITDFIPTAQIAAIQACTSTYDMTSAKAAADAAVSISTGSYTNGAGTVYWPSGCYYFASTIHQRATVVEKGMSSGLPAGGSTVWKFPANTTGIVIEATNTTNCATTGTSSSGQGATLDGITLIGGGGTFDGVSHGVSACVQFNLNNVNISAFAGDLVHIDTSSVGIADGWHITNGHLLGDNANTRYGVYTHGEDSNTGVMIGTLITNVGGSCIADQSFLGDTWIGVTCESAGVNTNLVYANQSGGSFLCLDPLGSCKTTTPVAGTTDATWYPVTFNSGYSAYSSSVNYIDGAEYSATNANTRAQFFGVYSEGGDPPSDVRGPSKIEGGLLASSWTSFSTAVNVASFDGGFVAGSRGFGGVTLKSNGSVGVEAVIGGGKNSDADIVRSVNNNISSDAWRIGWFNDGADIYETWNYSASNLVMVRTGPQTTETFGRTSAQPAQLEFPEGFFLSQGNDQGNARWVGTCTAVPSTTTGYAVGDRCFNNAPSELGTTGSKYVITGWILATVSGTPTWLPMRAPDGH